MKLLLPYIQGQIQDQKTKRPQAAITGTNTNILGLSKEVQAMEESYGLAAQVLQKCDICFVFFTMRNKNLTFIYYYYYYLPFRFSFVIKIYERIFNLPNFKKKFINLEKIILFIYFSLTYGNVIVIRKRKLFC